MTRQEKIEFNLEKMIYKELCALPDNKKLLFIDLLGKVRIYFINSLADNSDAYKVTLNNVLKRLQDNEYIVINKAPFSNHVTISKGLHFDKWSQSMNSDKNNTQVNIGNITAYNVQVGNENSLITNISLQELVQKVAESKDQKAKSLIKELLENSTVGSIIGAGVSALLNILTTKT